jgi:hypothetical protein
MSRVRRTDRRHALVPSVIRIVAVCASSVLAVATLTLPVQAQQPQSYQGCLDLVRFNARLEGKTTFSSKRDAKKLDQIASNIRTAQTPEAASVAQTLGKAKAGKARRRAVATAYQWCDSQRAYTPVALTVPPRVDVVDTDVIPITGASEPGATVQATAQGSTQSATADGNGAFTVNMPNLPLDQDVATSIGASIAARPISRATTTVKRTISEGAFKAQTQTIPYGELVKGGSQGQPVNYRVKVFQFDTSTGPNKFLGYVTAGSYDIWTDVAAFNLGDPAIANGVVNDDIVRVWGTVGSPLNYSTRIGGSNTVPSVDVKYLTKQ